MNKKIYIEALKHSDKGYNVYTNIGVISNVNANVVNCCLGRDVEYLLKVNLKDWTIGHGERFCSITENAYKDFQKYSG